MILLNMNVKIVLFLLYTEIKKIKMISMLQQSFENQKSNQ